MAVEGLAQKIPVFFRIGLVPCGEGCDPRFCRDLYLLVRHGGQIVDPVGHAGDSRGHEIERFAQIIVGEGREVGLVWHREASFGLLVLRDKQSLELGIGVIAQLLRHGGGLTLHAQELVFRAELHDFIGGQQIAAREVVAEAGAVTGFEAVSLEPGSFLADHLAQPLRGFKIIHPEDLLHPGIGNERRRALAVEVLELAHVLQDRPELQPIARHQPHGALHGLQTAQSGKLVQQEQRGRLEALCAPLSACGAALGPHGVNERLKVTRFQRLILTRLLGAKAPRRTALI